MQTLQQTAHGDSIHEESELKVILIFNAVTNYHKQVKNYVKNKL